MSVPDRLRRPICSDDIFGLRPVALAVGDDEQKSFIQQTNNLAALL
jgi:hypothetical protein